MRKEVLQRQKWDLCYHEQHSTHVSAPPQHNDHIKKECYATAQGNWRCFSAFYGALAQGTFLHMQLRTQPCTCMCTLAREVVWAKRSTPWSPEDPQDPAYDIQIFSFREPASSLCSGSLQLPITSVWIGPDLSRVLKGKAIGYSPCYLTVCPLSHCRSWWGSQWLHRGPGPDIVQVNHAWSPPGQ